MMIAFLCFFKLAEDLFETSFSNALFGLWSDLYFTGLITAAITSNERYHKFYEVFFLIQTTIVSFLIFQTLV